jgi:YHS domain-containing protein
MLFSYKTVGLKGIYGMAKRNGKYSQLVALGSLHRLMMRFGCCAHMFRHKKHTRNKSEADGNVEAIRWEHPHSATDPVCHQTVDPRIAKTTIHGGDVFYFCSDACRSKFEMSPDTYVGSSAISRQIHVSQG